MAKIIGPSALRTKGLMTGYLYQEQGVLEPTMLIRHRKALLITIGYLNLSILEYGQKERGEPSGPQLDGIGSKRQRRNLP